MLVWTVLVYTRQISVYTRMHSHINLVYMPTHPLIYQSLILIFLYIHSRSYTHFVNHLFLSSSLPSCIPIHNRVFHPVRLSVNWIHPVRLSVNWMHPVRLSVNWIHPVRLSVNWIHPVHLSVNWIHPVRLCVNWIHPVRLSVNWIHPVRLSVNWIHRFKFEISAVGIDFITSTME